MEMPQKLLLGRQQANQKQWGSYISIAQVFLHGSVTFLPMFHWDINVGDLEVLYFVVKELIDKENYKFFFFALKILLSTANKPCEFMETP
jgi:hypothetical protein